MTVTPESKSTVLVKHHLKRLKLPTMYAECEKTAVRASKENLDHLAFLLALSELELVERERRAAERRLKAAKFPANKTTSCAFGGPDLDRLYVTSMQNPDGTEEPEAGATYVIEGLGVVGLPEPRFAG